MAKVKAFNEEWQANLEFKVNDFAKKHKILQISYSTCKSGYTTYHYCMVLYED